MQTVSSRELVYTALFSLLSNIQIGGGAAFKTATRRLQHFADIPPESRPAIYMQHTGETTNPSPRGFPPKITLEVNVWIYVSTDQQPSGPVINPLLDAVELALAPNSAAGGNVQTLGGLVAHAWIEGATQIFEGDLGDDSVAIIPVRVLVS
jgi:hypothetical protein